MKYQISNIKYQNKAILHNSENGFSLVEIVVAICIFSLIAYGLIAMLSNIFTINRQQGGLLAGEDQARKLAFKLANEIRDAQVGNDGSKALNIAKDQEIVFFTDFDFDGSVERIHYYLSGGKLYKGVTEYNGTTYNTTTEQSIVVQNDVANSTTTPLFYYYNDSYTGTQSPLTQPVSQTAVRFIKLNLQILDKAGVKNSNYYSVTASGAIRNLKTNLGQ